MLFLLSPAKTLDYDSPVPAAVLRKATEPEFTAQAAELIEVLRRQSPDQVAALMDLSPTLAALNVERYAAWQRQATPANSRPAVLAFAGDVYTGLQAATLQPADLAWAQSHVLILSGLYGLLKPLDRLQPYRLEMGTALPTRQGKDLYAFWGERVTQALNARQADEAAPVIVNLASVEYARAVLRPSLRARVVDCVFEDWKGEGYKIISFFAKQARGLMARHAILRRARSVQALKSFDAEGYAFAPEVSQPGRLVFRRRL
jgi:cytoplasmic iron level regulating protein YaaA (DUF328/UPF0246 family)